MGAERASMSDDEECDRLGASQEVDRRILPRVLLINLGQWIGGLAGGVWAASTAAMGAALHNLADASVYAVSLYAVGRAAAIKVRATRLSGWLLIGLSFKLLVEVLRRFFGGEEHWVRQ